MNKLCSGNSSDVSILPKNFHPVFRAFAGMEAIWRVEVEDFPAFLVVDDKGNDFFKEWQTE